MNRSSSSWNTEPGAIQSTVQSCRSFRTKSNQLTDRAQFREYRGVEAQDRRPRGYAEALEENPGAGVVALGQLVGQHERDLRGVDFRLVEIGQQNREQFFGSRRGGFDVAHELAGYFTS